MSLGAWRRPHSCNRDMRERKRRRARGWKGWLGRARYCACCCAVFRSAPPHRREYDYFRSKRLNNVVAEILPPAGQC
jgi:hypothetical protein